MRTASGENHNIFGFVQRVNQQKIAAYMAFTMAVPISRQFVVKQLWWRVFGVRYYQQHNFFELAHIEAARGLQSVPVFYELLGVG